MRWIVGVGKEMLHFIIECVDTLPVIKTKIAEGCALSSNVKNVDMGIRDSGASFPLAFILFLL